MQRELCLSLLLHVLPSQLYSPLLLPSPLSSPLPQVVSDPALDKSGVYWSWDNEKSSLWFDQVDGALENNVSKEVIARGGGKKQGRGVAGLAWAGLAWAGLARAGLAWAGLLVCDCCRLYKGGLALCGR